MSENINKIIDKIINGDNITITSNDLKIEELLFKSKAGKTFLEYLLSYDISISNDVFEKIKSNIPENKQIEIINIIILSDKSKYLNQEMIEKLFKKDNDGNCLIEKYLTNKQIIKKLIPLINNSNLLLNFCSEKNDYNIMKYANSKVLMDAYSENKSVLQYLFYEKNIIPDILNLKTIFLDEQLIRFIVSNKLYDLLANTNDEYLLSFEVEKDKTILDILLENNYSLNINFFMLEKNIISLYKFGRLDLIKTANTFLLLKSVSDLFKDESIGNESFLEHMLDKGYQPIENIKVLSDISIELLEILYKKKQVNLLAEINFEQLLHKTSDGETYFDYVLENIKEKKIKKNISVYKPNGSTKLIAQYYLMLARHDMMNYVKKPNEEELLKQNKGKILLKELLELDRNLTLNKVLTEDVKSRINEIEFSTIKDIKQNYVDLMLKDEKLKDCLDEFENEIEKDNVSQEGNMLLRMLEELFLNDGMSDEQLIHALINGYRRALNVNYESNIKEIRCLIKIKQENKYKFCYIKRNEKPAFISSAGCIVCDEPIACKLLHETGHALHYYMTDEYILKNYEEIIQRVRKKSDTLIKISEYAKQYNELKNKITNLVEQNCKSFFELYYNEEKKHEIENLLLKTKSEKLEEFKELGFSDVDIDKIVDFTIKPEEYIEYQKKIFIKQTADNILVSEFGSYSAIGDILDAIYEGEIFSQVLKNSDGKIITGLRGHGLSYYYGTNHGFGEIIANFSLINKSKNSVKILELLRNIVGDELYNMLSDFYYCNIVEGKQIEERKTFGGI